MNLLLYQLSYYAVKKNGKRVLSSIFAELLMYEICCVFS